MPCKCSATAALLIGWGIATAPFGWKTALPSDPVPVDAIPDLGENQQIVFVDWMGRSPQDVEDQTTYPLTTFLLGIPGVKYALNAVEGVSEVASVGGQVSQLTIVPFYDRTQLIYETPGTLERALSHEILISITVAIVLVFNLRASFDAAAQLAGKPSMMGAGAAPGHQQGKMETTAPQTGAGQEAKVAVQQLFEPYFQLKDALVNADWLSLDREIRNPYFGDKMLKCGSVTETIQ